MDLSAYRIVQESLTNVLKHAQARHVEVLLRSRGRCVEIDVTDDGTAAPGPGSGGLGLIGMRERVAVYGGDGAGRAAGPGRVPGPGDAAVRGRRAGAAMTIRVLIADDQELVRAGFRKLLDAEDGITVVGEAADGGQAVTLATRLAPDVVLMDIRMPRMDGLEATRRLTGSTAVQVLILTTYDLDEYVFEALRAGASGFLLKDSPPDSLISGIATVAHGDALLAPRSPGG